MTQNLVMPVPPEVLFHRYFQRLKSKEDRELYQGKADLDRLPDEPLPRKLLEDVQLMLNAALAAEDRGTPPITCFRTLSPETSAHTSSR